MHSRRGEFTRTIGYALEFTVSADGRVRYYQKDGVNVGTSGLLRHYPEQGLTLAILGIGEDAILEPMAAFDAAVSSG